MTSCEMGILQRRLLGILTEPTVNLIAIYRQVEWDGGVFSGLRYYGWLTTPSSIYHVISWYIMEYL